MLTYFQNFSSKFSHATLFYRLPKQPFQGRHASYASGANCGAQMHNTPGRRAASFEDVVDFVDAQYAPFGGAFPAERISAYTSGRPASAKHLLLARQFGLRLFLRMSFRQTPINIPVSLHDRAQKLVFGFFMRFVESTFQLNF